MELIAHRGFAGVYPENTLAAFRYAAERADGIELDVRRCGSGELVVVHDEELDRVTELSGTVGEYSHAELDACDVLESGEGVPKLTEALEAVPPSVTIHVEIKETGAAAEVAEIVADADRDIVVSSFDPDALRAVDERWDGPLAFTFDRNPREKVDVAASLDCAFVHPHKRLCFTSNVVENAHDAGMEVNAWTVRRRTAGRLLELRGVDGLIADTWTVVG